jgi:hypothetical protein
MIFEIQMGDGSENEGSLLKMNAGGDAQRIPVGMMQKRPCENKDYCKYR